jgi:hypothetical protein
MWRRIAYALSLSVVWAAPALAQDWATKMFETTNHDFGSVARGAKAQFQFVLSNIYVEPVHIVDAQPSCHCTIVTIDNPTLKTYEKGAIVATLNTNAFQGQRGATITVTFDKPFYAQATLSVQGFIRTDVVFEPGSVDLGALEQGTQGDQKVSMYYSGWQADWKVLGVNSPNPSVTARAVETARQGNQVWYDVFVHLDKGAPAGYLRDHVMLTTNDQGNAQIPLLVEGRVLPGVVVTPSPLILGQVRSGQQVTTQVIVKGSKPFRILGITANDESLKFSREKDEAAKTIHFVPVTFTAGNDQGNVAKAFRIQTDIGSPEVSAYAVITPQEHTVMKTATP